MSSSPIYLPETCLFLSSSKLTVPSRVVGASAGQSRVIPGPVCQWRGIVESLHNVGMGNQWVCEDHQEC